MAGMTYAQARAEVAKILGDWRKRQGKRSETAEEKWHRLWLEYNAAEAAAAHAYSAEATKNEHRAGRLLRARAAEAWKRLSEHSIASGAGPLAFDDPYGRRPR